MRASKVLAIIFTACFVFSRAVFADVIASPNQLMFGPLPHNAGPQNELIAITWLDPIDNGDCFLELNAQVTGPTGMYQVSVPNQKLSANKPSTTVTVISDSSVSGKYTGDLNIHYVSNCDEKDGDIKVSLSTETLCTNANEDCDPIGPLCNVDNNEEAITKLVIPNDDPDNDIFLGAIAGPLNRISREHYMTLGSYRVSAQDVLSVSGLGAFIDFPAKCCVSCDSSCPAEVELTRVPFSDKVAEFEWHNAQALVFHEKTEVSQAYKLEFDVPQNTSGRMIISPVGIEFHFDSPQPTLSFSTTSSDIFVGEASCVKGSLLEGIVRQLNPGNQIPMLDLIVTGE